MIEVVPSVVELAASDPALARHMARPFMPLSAMTDHTLPEAKVAPSSLLRKVLEAVAGQVPDDAYAAVQRRHPSLAHIQAVLYLDGLSPGLKDLDLPCSCASKVAFAKQAGLHEREGARASDFGAGPSHFGIMRRLLRVDCHGMDLKVQPLPGSGLDRHLRDDLARLFDVARHTQTAWAFVPLEADRRFTHAARPMGGFCVPRLRSGRRHRAWPEGACLPHDLAARLTEPDCGCAGSNGGGGRPPADAAPSLGPGRARPAPPARRRRGRADAPGAGAPRRAACSRPRA